MGGAGLVQHLGESDSRDPKGRVPATHPCDQIPLARLEYQASGIDGVAHVAVVGPGVLQGQSPARPHGIGDRRQPRQRTRGPIPAGGVHEDPPADSLRGDPTGGRQGGQDLALHRVQRGAEAQLVEWTWDAHEKEGFGFSGGESSEIGPVPVEEADSAVGTPGGVDRHPRRAECVHVAVDGPDRDLELPRQLRSGKTAPGLKKEDDGDEPVGAHDQSWYFPVPDRGCQVRVVRVLFMVMDPPIIIERSRSGERVAN